MTRHFCDRCTLEMDSRCDNDGTRTLICLDERLQKTGAQHIVMTTTVFRVVDEKVQYLDICPCCMKELIGQRKT